MNTVTIEQGQSLTDIAIQHCGSVSAIKDIMKLNKMSATDTLVAGTTIAIPDVVDQKVVSYLKTKNIVPAAHSEVSADGIGSMKIGSTFIVS